MQVLATAIYWAALLSLVMMLVPIVLSMMSSTISWRSLLSSADSAWPGLTRTGFLFGNVALAAAFLLAVLDSDGQITKLEQATDLLGVLDISAVTGTASAAYLWSKVSNRGF